MTFLAQASMKEWFIPQVTLVESHERRPEKAMTLKNKKKEQNRILFLNQVHKDLTL